MTSSIYEIPAPSQQQTYDPLLGDIGFMTCMTLVLLGNYAQTGHLGGPLAYTPYNVAAHLVGPENGGLRYDYRRPSILTATNSCSRRAIRSPPATRCG